MIKKIEQDILKLTGENVNRKKDIQNLEENNEILKDKCQDIRRFYESSNLELYQKFFEAFGNFCQLMIGMI